MPKQTRWRIKRQLDHAIKHIEQGRDWVVMVGSEYEKVHPDIYESFCSIVTALELVKGAVSDMRNRI
jgi:hypothetical protein